MEQVGEAPDGPGLLRLAEAPPLGRSSGGARYLKAEDAFWDLPRLLRAFL